MGSPEQRSAACGGGNSMFASRPGAAAWILSGRRADSKSMVGSECILNALPSSRYKPMRWAAFCSFCRACLRSELLTPFPRTACCRMAPEASSAAFSWRTAACNIFACQAMVSADASFHSRMPQG